MTTVRAAPQIVVPLQATFLDAIGNGGNGGRGPKRKCQYTEEEKKILEIHKEEYKKTTTTTERHNLLRNHILVNIFNYWYEKGIVTPSIVEEELSERITV